jgi:hypothetical protein
MPRLAGHPRMDEMACIPHPPPNLPLEGGGRVLPSPSGGGQGWGWGGRHLFLTKQESSPFWVLDSGFHRNDGHRGAVFQKAKVLRQKKCFQNDCSVAPCGRVGLGPQNLLFFFNGHKALHSRSFLSNPLRWLNGNDFFKASRRRKDIDRL